RVATRHSPSFPTRRSSDLKALDAALEAADYEGLRGEQRQRRERGDRLQLGIGIGSYVEISGGGSEFGSVSVAEDGSVTVVTGSRSEEHTSELQSPDHLVCR